MYEKEKNKMKRDKLVRLLNIVIQGTQTTAGCAFLPQADAEYLSKADPDMVEVNPKVKDAHGNIAVRASLIAMQQFQQAQGAAQSATEETASAFAIEKGIPVPPSKRGGVATRTSKYPFDQLEIGDAFFVPAPADKPKFAKTFASTVSSAQRKYEKRGEPRKFTTRPAEVNGVKGVRVWRIEVSKPQAVASSQAA